MGRRISSDLMPEWLNRLPRDVPLKVLVFQEIFDHQLMALEKNDKDESILNCCSFLTRFQQLKSQFNQKTDPTPNETSATFTLKDSQSIAPITILQMEISSRQEKNTVNATSSLSPTSHLNPSKSHPNPIDNEVIIPKKKFTRKDLIFSKLTEPNSHHLKQDFFPDFVPFSIEDCKDCNLYLFSSLAQCTIDACQNCFIFCGPTEGSVFIRDCKDCVIVVACQQLRLRDCENITLVLYVKGQPVIETSSNITFSCFTYFYPSLLTQFKRANLPISDNAWWNIYDFSPTFKDQGNNLSILHTPLDPNLIRVPPPDLIDFQVSNSTELCCIPFSSPPTNNIT